MAAQLETGPIDYREHPEAARWPTSSPGFFRWDHRTEEPPFPAKGCIVLGNCVLSVPRFVANEKPYCIPHTPRLFATWKLPFDFDENAPNPDLWMHTLREIFDESDECESSQVDLLQEWFGYCVSGDMSQQKMLLLIGPPASGKGVICTVLTSLMGSSNVVSISPSSLECRFGLAMMRNKPLALLPDARVSGRNNQAAIVERLLSIVGNDRVHIDIKHKDPVTVRLPSRIVWTSNELPTLSETSSALQRRLLLLKTAQSFVGRENKALATQLEAELPGIFLWAVEGYRRLLERGHFVQPDAGADDLDEFRELSSPIAAFAAECLYEGEFASMDQLWLAWRNWTTANNKPLGSPQLLSRNLAAAGFVRCRPRGDGSRTRGFQRIEVRPTWLHARVD